ncbi:MAG: hypothetical protein ACT4QC_01140 [Planctomycetaceae bacterium]
MDYSEYASRISFRLLQPDVPRPAGFKALNRFASRVGVQLEMWMTALPEGQSRMQRRLRRICRLRRRSTFAVAALINRGVSQMPAGQAYVALGVDEGFPLFAGMAGNRDRLCIGVDRLAISDRRRDRFLQRFVRWRGLRHDFHEMDGLEYLEHVHKGPIGFCVCCGRRDHVAQFALLRALEPHLGDAAAILINDSNRPEIRRAAHDFAETSPFQYRVLLDVQTPRSGHPTYGNGVLLLARSARGALPLEAQPRAA